VLALLRIQKMPINDNKKNGGPWPPFFTRSATAQIRPSNKTMIETTAVTSSNALVLIAVWTRQYLQAAHCLIFSTDSLLHRDDCTLHISIWNFTNT
jgi:hypothetical protein